MFFQPSWQLWRRRKAQRRRLRPSSLPASGVALGTDLFYNNIYYFFFENLNWKRNVYRKELSYSLPTHPSGWEKQKAPVWERSWRKRERWWIYKVIAAVHKGSLAFHVPFYKHCEVSFLKVLKCCNIYFFLNLCLLGFSPSFAVRWTCIKERSHLGWGDGRPAPAPLPPSCHSTQGL